MKTSTRLILTITVFLISITTGIKADSQENSEWLLQVRNSGKYVFEDAGTFKTFPQPYSDAFVWNIEAAGAEKLVLRNKESGHYVCMNENGQVIAGENPTVLEITGFPYSKMRNVGWYRLMKAGDISGKYLREDNGSICYGEVDENTGYSHHWNLVRLSGASIPYVLSGSSVSESSFMGQRRADAVSYTEIHSDYHGDKTWKLSEDISAFPKFTMKGNTLVPALYNMALEEMLSDILPDSTFSAGAAWGNTWTRDAVYSIWFSFSWILPEISRMTLEKQTLKNPAEALQDTGTGGSYPISTDRVVWALAAWEYYLTTGDEEWLEDSYKGLRNTALKDLHVAFDPEVGLFRGETCSMDWRTHTYPNWFTNAHIGESFSSGTNVLHLFLYRFLEQTASITGASADEQELWKNTAETLTTSINKYFWDSNKMLYDCYLYPAFMNYMPSGKVGVMSNGLAAVCGAASEEQVAAIVENYPLYPYGAPTLYPTKPDGFAYHNKGVWPVWEATLMFAAKNSGNMSVLNHLMQTLVRSSALFLTHKENWSYDTGYDRNTALNSDSQLWSVSTYIAMVYRVLFGIGLHCDGVSFSPVVPEYFGGEMHLEGLKYRKATIDIAVYGYGDTVESIAVNGHRKNADWILPANAKGKYEIVINMKNSGRQSSANIVAAGPGHCWAPEEPTVCCENGTLIYTETPGYTFSLAGNGKSRPIRPPYDMNKESDGYWSIYATAENGMTSDLSNPILNTSWTARYEAEDFADINAVSDEYKGYSGRGYVKDPGISHTDIDFEIELPHDGDYILHFTGSNGHGPHDVYCTIRSLFWDGEDKATVFLEAYGDWNVWTSSNHVIIRGAKAGKHTVSIRFNPENKGFDNNMSFNKDNLNDWNIDYMTVSAL